MNISYPGFESQEEFGQKQNYAFQSNGDVLQYKVCDANNPNEIEEVETVDIWLCKYKAATKKRMKTIVSGFVKALKIGWKVAMQYKGKYSHSKMTHGKINLGERQDGWQK